MDTNNPNHQDDPRRWAITFNGVWDREFSILNSDLVNSAWQQWAPRARPTFTLDKRTKHCTKPEQWSFRHGYRPQQITHNSDYSDIDWRAPHKTILVHDMPERFDQPAYEWLTPDKPETTDLLEFLGWKADGPVQWPNLATKEHERTTLIGILNLQASLVAKCSPMPLDCFSALWLLTRDCMPFPHVHHTFDENFVPLWESSANAWESRWVLHIGGFWRKQQTICVGLIIDQTTACSYYFDPCWNDKHAEDRIDAMIKQACKVYGSEGAEQYLRSRIYTIGGYQVLAPDRWAAPLALFEWVKNVSYTGRVDELQPRNPDQVRQQWITGITREFADVPLLERGDLLPLRRTKPVNSRKHFEENRRKEKTATPAPQAPQAPQPSPPPSTPASQIQNVADSPNFWNKRHRDTIIAELQAKGTWKARDPTTGVAPSTTIAHSPFLIKTSPRTPVVPHLGISPCPDLHCPPNNPKPWEAGDAEPLQWMPFDYETFDHLRSRFGGGFTFSDFTNDYYWNAMPLSTAGVMLTNLYNAQGLIARKEWLSSEEIRSMGVLSSRDSPRTTYFPITGHLWDHRFPVVIGQVDKDFVDVKKIQTHEVFVLLVNPNGEHWTGLIIDQLYGAVYYFDSGFGDDGNAHFTTCMTNLVNLYKNCGAPDDLLDILRSNSWIVLAPQQEDAWSCGLHTAEFIRAYVREGLTTPTFSSQTLADSFYAQREKVTRLEALRSRWISWITGEFCDLRSAYKNPLLRNINMPFDDFISQINMGEFPTVGLLPRPANSKLTALPVRPAPKVKTGSRPLVNSDSDSPLSDLSHTPSQPSDDDGGESGGDPGSSLVLSAGALRNRQIFGRPDYPDRVPVPDIRTCTKEEYVDQRVDPWAWMKSNTQRNSAFYPFSKPADWEGWGRFNCGLEWEAHHKQAPVSRAPNKRYGLRRAPQ
ncbi:hypothetical protein QIS74_01097 [Colletotrichum tabaci]|uniref:Ubiquitin-like protease family profile domain-containing protein n=1 Tax=Colletotrichum tabaci TaxID=1209068 RepID=A0AAV9STN5_9PEZI